MTTRQLVARPPLGTRDHDHDLDLTRLHHLRCAAAEMDEPLYHQQQRQHHQHYDEHEDDPYYDEPEPRLEIIDEEEDEDENEQHPERQASPDDGQRVRSPAAPDTHPSGGAEEIVRNALFLLALKHPSLKQRPAMQEVTRTARLSLKSGLPFSEGTAQEEEEEDTTWPGLTLEADWKGQETSGGVMASTTAAATTSSAQTRADKRARREMAKQAYRDQRRMRRRERRRLHEQQKQQQKHPQPSFMQTEHPAPSSESSHASLFSATISPSPLSPLSTGESSLRKRARVSRSANSDDGEAATTSYDEAVDNDDIEIDEGDDDDDDDGDVLLLCEEEILDSGSTGSSGNHQRKRKRPVERKRATADQVVVLEKMYNEDKFPSSELIRHTGERLGMKPSKVKNWFQNKRAKERRVAAGKERPSSAAAKAKKAAAAAAAAASAKKPLRLSDRKQSAEVGKAKEAKGEWSTSRAPMDVDDGPIASEGFSSSLPFSLPTSERRTLALPSSAPPKRRYEASSVSLLDAPPSRSSSLRPSLALPPLLGGAPLHFLSSSLSPTLPGDPHQCQRH